MGRKNGRRYVVLLWLSEALGHKARKMSEISSLLLNTQYQGGAGNGIDPDTRILSSHKRPCVRKRDLNPDARKHIVLANHAIWTRRGLGSRWSVLCNKFDQTLEAQPTVERTSTFNRIIGNSGSEDAAFSKQDPRSSAQTIRWPMRTTAVSSVSH